MLYRCPTGIRGEMRTYTITDAMNGLRRNGTYSGNSGIRVGRTVLWVKRRTEIIAPGPAKRLVFLDEGRVTGQLCLSLPKCHMVGPPVCPTR